jgi:predicted RND superfamily exporter protein
MSTAPLRARIEERFERFGTWIYRHPWRSIAAVLLPVALLASQLPRLTVETNLDAMLLESDPTRVNYDAFRNQFGRDEFIVISLRPRAIFDLEFLNWLRALHEDLEESIPYLDEVTSLVNARATRGEEDRLIVDDLMEEWPESDADLAALRARVVANPLYRNLLISEDAQVTAIMIRTQAYSSIGNDSDELAGFEDDGAAVAEEPPLFLTGAENSELVHALQDVIERHRTPSIEIHVAGSPVMVQLLQEYLFRDMQRFTALALLCIGVLLFAIFRRLIAVVLPLLVVVLALVSTMGALALSGLSVTFGTQLLPPFILAVGVGYAVHILAIFFQQRDEAGAEPGDAIAHAMGHSGLAIVITALTTAGGMVSFVSATLLPIRYLGIFTPLGIMLACVFSLVLVPALLALIPIPPARARSTTTGLAERVLVSAGAFAVRRPWAVLVPVAIVLAAALAGVPRIGISHDPLTWLAPDAPVRIAMNEVDRDLGGAIALEILVATGTENGLHEPDELRRLEAIAQRAVSFDHPMVKIGKATSLADVVKEIHRALNEDRPEFYAIPDDRRLVAQELLLFENSGSDDLEDVTDSQFSVGRISLKSLWSDALYYRDFIDKLVADIQPLVGEARIQTTGLLMVMGSTIDAVIVSLTRSYVIALMIITPLMILLIGSLRIGLASMVPNLAPIIMVLGLMGWMGVPMDFFTLMVGGIAIGLVVDDTIHFMHNFRRYYLESGDTSEAVSRTLSTTGRALLFTSAVLTVAFLIYTLSEMRSLNKFGALAALAVVLAFVLDILVSPALMALLMRRKGVAL